MRQNIYKPFQDENALNVKLYNATQEFIREFQHQKEREEDRQWVYSQVMNSISHNIINTASPAIDEIADKINSLIK